MTALVKCPGCGIKTRAGLLARPTDAATAYTRYLEMEPEPAQADAIRAPLDALQRLVDAGLGRAQTQ